MNRRTGACHETLDLLPKPGLQVPQREPELLYVAIEDDCLKGG